MDYTQLFKNTLETQKQALHNAMELNNLCRKQAESINNYWMGALNLSPDMRGFVEKWRSVAMQGREDFKKAMDSSYDNWQTYLDRFGQNGLKPKAKADTKKAK